MSVEGWRRSVLIGVGLAAALLLIGTIGYLTSDHPGTVTAASPEQVSLVAVPGGTAAVSIHHGPFSVAAGRARGFTHDELGAALAASNIAPRITAAAAPAISAPTLTEQCWGDPASAAQRAASTVPQLTPGRDDLIVRGLYYKAIAGDPTGDYVVISMLADTDQARAAGGLARIDATLRWSDQDWQLRVPVSEPTLQPDTSGYTLLGPTS